MKVIVTDNIAADGIDILKAAGLNVEVLADLPKDKLLNHLSDTDAVVTRSATTVDKKFLDAAENLKVIVRAGVGIDNVDITEASRRGILVMNVPAANTIAAAEHTMNHILS